MSCSLVYKIASLGIIKSFVYVLRVSSRGTLQSNHFASCYVPTATKARRGLIYQKFEVYGPQPFRPVVLDILRPRFALHIDYDAS